MRSGRDALPQDCRAGGDSPGNYGSPRQLILHKLTPLAPSGRHRPFTTLLADGGVAMNNRLDGKKVAILVADGFEQAEMPEPRKALEEAGAQIELISPAKGKVKGWQHTQWGDEFSVDVPLQQAN